IESITEFTKYLYENLVPCGVYVAADVFGTVIDNETDQKIVGQDYVKMAENLDYICPMVYPSHYHNGAYGIAVPDADPYATIYAAAVASDRQLQAVSEEDCAHVRLWLQSFTASWVPNHISYGPRQIREQIKAVYDAGYEEWILWNATVRYQPDSLLTPEEAEVERQQWEAEESVSENSMQMSEEAEVEKETTASELAGQ
ncbi:MAG: putative glycoside hydrolase, partial [Lachnospiraceae bacterium]|nr:putative glycoside hydrolase [Lachnospiraceae bacterium]